MLLPVVFAYGLMARYVTNVPLIDDFWHVFAFALAYHGAPTAGAKALLVMTNQVGPYKLIFQHALVALQLETVGRLCFPAMILAGNLTVAGIFAVLAANTLPREMEQKWRVLALAPVSFLVFTLNYAETVNWAISGLQQPAVILFALAALHFLTKREGQGGAFWAAWLFAVLACLTYANGLLVWIAGFGFLLLGERRGWKIAGWGVGFAGMAGTYLYHYQHADAGVSSFWEKALFLAMFVGGGMENMHHRPVPYVSVAVGLVVLAVIAVAVKKRFDRVNPFFFWAMVWVMLTAIVVAKERTAMGLAVSLSSRYKIYCDLLLVFCYVYGLDWWSKRRERPGWMLGAAIATSAAIFVTGNVAGGKFLETRQGRAETAMRGYMAHPESTSPMFLVEDELNPGEVATEDEARKQMNEAIRVGIYQPYR